MKKILTIVIATSLSFNLFALTPKNGEFPSHCEQIAALHGLLSKAQLECGFTQYNQELIENTRQCFKDELGDKYGLEVIKFGLTEFEKNVKKTGKANLCKKLLKDFPEYIKK